MSTRAVSVRRRRKVMAIIAGGTALGVAGLVTLAAWNDNEWVFGGTSADGGNGVGTSSFNVQQYAWSGATAPAADAEEFDDSEDQPGNALTFNVDPSGLTPGDTIYAPVALKTESESIAGTLTLTKPVAATDAADEPRSADDAGGALWNALRYSVRVTTDATTAASCGPGTFATDADNNAGSLIVDNKAFTADLAIDEGGFVSQTLDSDGGNVQYYCFEIELPDIEANQALQGRTVFPAWRFAAKSTSD
jgi:predicted ribosomally synthesized peptide with SipW-like signal peptide